nr:MAG TPA: hypothetical protein [Caudoviricetes sp.]
MLSGGSVSHPVFSLGGGVEGMGKENSFLLGFVWEKGVFGGS